MQDSKALAILNLVDFRYKAEEIKNTSYRKLLDTYRYMLNDNLSICYVKTYKDFCCKIREKKFNLNRTMIREIKNESKQNSNIWKV